MATGSELSLKVTLSHRRLTGPPCTRPDISQSRKFRVRSEFSPCALLIFSHYRSRRKTMTSPAGGAGSQTCHRCRGQARLYVAWIEQPRLYRVPRLWEGLTETIGVPRLPRDLPRPRRAVTNRGD